MIFFSETIGSITSGASTVKQMPRNNGYIALGIKPENKMQGADMLLGSIAGSQATVTDAYATGTFGPHPADTELGGTNDVLGDMGTGVVTHLGV